jgi:TPR repeat protein
VMRLPTSVWTPLFAAVLMVAGPVAAQDSLDEITRRAESGDEGSIHRLCYGSAYGREGVRRNDADALRWCAKGDELGIPSSTVLLAEIYFRGQGTKADLVKARSLYLRAAGMGHAYAQYMAGTMLWLGEGGPRDQSEAMRYIDLAAAAGLPPAIDAKRQFEEHKNDSRRAGGTSPNQSIQGGPADAGR